MLVWYSHYNYNMNMITLLTAAEFFGLLLKGFLLLLDVSIEAMQELSI